VGRERAKLAARTRSEIETPAKIDESPPDLGDDIEVFIFVPVSRRGVPVLPHNAKPELLVFKAYSLPILPNKRATYRNAAMRRSQRGAAAAEFRGEFTRSSSGAAEAGCRRCAEPVRLQGLGAIDMGKVELQYGKDPEIPKLADDIIKTQEIEIAGMNAWLAKHKK
jgi:hypothetical protein